MWSLGSQEAPPCHHLSQTLKFSIKFSSADHRE
uniref:Uncharacterized protein n=1 Tax=Setaria viridis TaxID=4556 RepID=A0A4U6V2A2_SETVI|nr:hypothetical protein SEVIR_4G272001v2 [Setaria viridis]